MKITLDQTYILNGAFYGPGEVEVDAETVKALQKRMAELAPKADEAQADDAGAAKPARAK